MAKVILLVVGIGIALAGVFVLSSQDSRREVLDRVDAAASSLANDGDESAPRIVREQQRKERKRQNNTWTPENQVNHPVEYCQAQLEEVAKMEKKLDVQLHRLATSKSAVERTLADAETQTASFTKFLTDAKVAYRTADAANTWPLTINGCVLTREKAQEKIVEAANRLSVLKQTSTTSKANLVRLGKKLDGLHAERRALVTLRERLTTTISDIKTKQMLDAEKGIKDALNAINDSLASLSPASSDPSLEELIQPDNASVREATFNAIMAQP